MSQDVSAELRRPRTDDRPLWDLSSGLWAYLAVLVARQIGLFALLGEKQCSLGEVCERLKLNPRPAEGLLSVTVSLGLARFEAGQYALTPVAEEYLLESSLTYFGAKLDLDLVILSQGVEELKKAVLTDSPQIYGGGDMFAAHEQRPELARDFTRAMHSVSMAPALKWPEALDLSMHHMMLDIGGGSGAHSIGATLRWPNLKATVLDIGPVCEVAQEFAAAEGLQERITTHIADLWHDPFPGADVHFYSMIYHDWPPEKCRFLTRKSFESLKPGGRIIIHEILLNDNRTGPLAAAAFNIVMLYYVPGQQYSGRELCGFLHDAGFREVEVKPTFGYWGIVTGRKP